MKEFTSSSKEKRKRKKLRGNGENKEGKNYEE